MSRRPLLLAVAGLAILLLVAYSNHFDNPFTFDDTHTIVANSYIQDVRNIPLFFTDIKYYGTNPGNRSYNPLLVTLNAIDYWLARGLKPQAFHADIFFCYLVQLALMVVMFTKIFRLVDPGWRNHLFTVVLVAFYGLHTANAETINYIIMRSDSFSTLCIVASLVLYQVERTRRWHLYLVTMLMAMLTKETGVMFAPILLCYILTFEEGVSLTELVTFRRPDRIVAGLLKAGPALFISIGFFIFVRRAFMAGSELIGSGTSPWHYFHSQWVVIMHYVGNFFLPFDLSPDPDFDILSSPWNNQTLFSLIGILLLVWIAFRTSREPRTRPIAFGILWFFIALAPTSSFIPFGQVANEHRTFFPYVGATLALGWWLHLMYEKYEARIGRSVALRRMVVVLPVTVLLLHAHGVYRRNIVWGSEATLWADAAQKSPRNGRALMNYGLTLMERGDLERASSYFRRSLELMPRWAAININMGILRNAMGFPEEAEEYFKKALAYQPAFVEGYYFYARWLIGRNRKAEALDLVNEGLRLSPGHVNLQRMRDQLMVEVDPVGRLKQLEQQADSHSTAPNYLDLSLAYYKAGRYEDCLGACEKVLALDPMSPLAYNNMCSAYNALGEWDKAIAACNKALELAPQFALARNNLNEAVREKGRHAVPSRR